MPYWDERVAKMARAYPDVRWDQYHIDILTARFVLSPERFDVVVASNLFGDILSDLGPACTGTIGIAPAGNLNPERDFPSLFEPVHGSAPDIAGQGHCEPGRPDLVGRHDAGAPGGDRGCRRHPARQSNACWRKRLYVHAISAARPTRKPPARPSSTHLGEAAKLMSFAQRG